MPYELQDTCGCICGRIVTEAMGAQEQFASFDVGEANVELARVQRANRTPRHGERRTGIAYGCTVGVRRNTAGEGFPSP